MRRKHALAAGAAGLSALLVAAGINVYVGSDTIPGASCAFPSCFPSASNTGYPAGTTLTAYTGPTTITTNNTVIDGKEITDCLEIRASNVTIKNSYIHNSTCDIMVHLGDEIPGFSSWSLTVQDTTISCGTGWPNGTKGSTAFSNSFITARRLDISGCENGFDVDQEVDIQDSYIHDLLQCTNAECGGGDGSHTDGVQISPGGYYNPPGSATTVCGAKDLMIKHNTIYSIRYGAPVPTSDELDYTVSVVIMNSCGASHNVTIEKNLFAGGGFTLNCTRPDNGVSAIDSPIIDNHFSTRYSSTIGFYGPSIYCDDEIGPVTGNVYHETGLPVTLD